MRYIPLDAFRNVWDATACTSELRAELQSLSRIPFLRDQSQLQSARSPPSWRCLIPDLEALRHDDTVSIAISVGGDVPVLGNDV